MGCAGSKEDTFSRFPALTDWQIEQLRLPAPPLNGFDSFLKLAWCRDLKEEGEKAEKAAKAAQKAGKEPPTGEIPKTYYICLVADYGPYADNVTVNLQKEPEAYTHLPKWQDPDYMEDCLRHERFYQNDAWILEHVPNAIRKPSGYLYDEQFIAAFQHWNTGLKPPAHILHQHHLTVATAIYRELHGYAVRNGRDKKGRERSRTIRKLEDLLRSLELDVKLLTECQKTVEAEYKIQVEQEAKEKEKRDKEEKIKAQAAEAQRVADEKKAEQQKQAAEAAAKKKKDKKVGKKKSKKKDEDVIIIVHDDDDEKDKAKEKEGTDEKTNAAKPETAATASVEDANAKKPAPTTTTKTTAAAKETPVAAVKPPVAAAKAK